MARENFNAATDWLLVHEGGYVNHPRDPGGATNRGVTQATYNGFRRRIGKPAQSVRLVTNEEVHEIYKSQYWNLVWGDELPPGLDYAMYDFAVNSGPSRAVKFIQAIVGQKQDGIMGNMTLGAIKSSNDVGNLIIKLCENRLAWMKRLRTWNTFGVGWTRRVMGDTMGVQAFSDTGVIDRSIKLFQGRPEEIIAPIAPIAGRALEEDLGVETKTKDAITDSSNWMKVTLGAAPATLTAMFTAPEGPLQLALASIVFFAGVALVLIVAMKIWRSGKVDEALS